MTDNQKRNDIFNLIYSGNGFKNPLKENLDNFNTVIDNQITEITILSNISDPNGIPNWSQAELNNLATIELSSIKTKLIDFETHTNRLSGLTLLSSPTNSKLNINALLGILSSGQEMETELGNDEDVQQGLFSSILNGNDFLIDGISYFKDLHLKIQSLPPYDNTIQPIPSEVTGHVTNTNNTIDNFISDDENYNIYILSRLGIYSFSNSLTNPSVDWLELLNNYIATDELKDLINS